MQTQAQIKPLKFSHKLAGLVSTGQKTQTRRPIKPQPDQTRARDKPVSQVGCYSSGVPAQGQAYYWRDKRSLWNSSEPFFCPYGWTGDRFTLEQTGQVFEITSVRGELLRAISEVDTYLEGIDPGLITRYVPPQNWFATLWNSFYGELPGLSWQDNPWVWVIEFKKCEETGGNLPSS